MARQNLCINPALDVNVAGWGGGSTPTRTAVSGFDRSWAARYTAGTYMATSATAMGAITAGLTYTLSVYLRPVSFNGSGAIYVEWINGGGSGFGYPTVSYSVTGGVVSRASITAVAPSGAVAARLILDGINYSVNNLDATMVLIEQAAALDAYFDGSSPGASWDGTAGSSSSTLAGTTVSGALASVLPPLGGGLAGRAVARGTLAAALPPLGGALAGRAWVSGGLAAALPGMAAAGAGWVTARGPLAGALPPVQGHLVAAVRTGGPLAGVLPPAQGNLAGAARTGGVLAGALPPLGTALGGAVAGGTGSLRVVLPSLGGGLAGAARVAGTAAGALPPLAAAGAGRIVAPSGVLAATLPTLTIAIDALSDAVPVAPARLTSGSAPAAALRAGSEQLVTLTGGAQ